MWVRVWFGVATKMITRLFNLAEDGIQAVRTIDRACRTLHLKALFNSQVGQMRKLDKSKLLGFDQAPRAADRGTPGAKVGAKAGAKLGVKMGAKAGVKGLR